MPSKKLKFRIVKYYDRFEAQIQDQMYGNWKHIGSPTGYATPEEAKDFCQQYKRDVDKVVEEFEL